MIPLEYIGFCSSPNGYGYAARNYILALHSIGQSNIRLVPLDTPISKAIVLKSYNALRNAQDAPENHNALQVFHCIPDMFRRIRKNPRAIAVIAFEATPLPKHWVELLQPINSIIVPSQFNFQLFEKVGIPVSIVPHCLNFDEFRPDVAPMFPKSDVFTFFFCSIWKKRKGYEILLEAWKNHFAENENVRLVIKPNDAKLCQSTIQQFFSILPKNITILGDIYTDDQLPGLFRSFDCLVSSSIGEAFFIPGLQSLAVGVPIIVLDYGGVKEYANEKNSYLLKVEGFTKKSDPMDGYFQFRDCVWPYVSAEQLGTKMKYAVEHREKTIDREELSRKFGYPTVGKKFAEVAEVIEKI
jgi:glycosyltransferase involved in cell wall biosynthesis